jgi:hypothetical protein
VVPQPRETPAPRAPSDATASRARYDFAPLYGTCEPGEGGSGRTYMGREISEVMGHFGVGWLERPEREREERTDLLVRALKLKPTDAVADIGAGSGYFTMRMAPMVPEGVVYATDIRRSRNSCTTSCRSSARSTTAGSSRTRSTSRSSSTPTTNSRIPAR